MPSRERSGLDSSPFSPRSLFSVPFLFVHLVLDRGTFQMESPRVPNGPLPGPLVGQLPITV